MVMQRELLSLSPEVRAQVADITIKKRIPHEAMVQTMVEEASNDSKPKRHMCFKPVLHTTIEEVPNEDNLTSATYEATLASHMLLCAEFV